MPAGYRKFAESAHFKKKVIKRFSLLVGLLFFVCSYSTMGFFWIEGRSFFDSFYMAVITFTTVGFGEVFPLSNAGRLFAISSVFLGLASSGISVGVLTNLLFEDTLMSLLKDKKMEKNLRHFHNHFIVCGFGTTGRRTTEMLLNSGHQVVVIDLNIFEEDLGEHGLFLQGDARKDDILEMARISEAKGLAATLSEDADNVFVVLTARGLNNGLEIVSRYKDEDTEKKLMRAGANQAVSPYLIGGSRLALALDNPLLFNMVESNNTRTMLSAAFQYVNLPAHCRGDGISLSSSGIPQLASDVLIIAALGDTGKAHINPSGQLPLKHIGQLVVLGEKEAIDHFRGHLRRSTPPSP